MVTPSADRSGARRCPRQRYLSCRSIPEIGGAPGEEKGRNRRGSQHSGHRLPCAAATTAYRELGPNFFDERDKTRVQRRLVQRLEKLGFTVELRPAA